MLAASDTIKKNQTSYSFNISFRFKILFKFLADRCLGYVDTHHKYVGDAALPLYTLAREVFFLGINKCDDNG